MSYLVSLAVLLIGSLLAVQGALNAKLAEYLNHPIHAAVVSFSVGTIALFLIAMMLRVDAPSLNHLKSIPLHLFIGGLLGALMVSSAIFLIPKIGAASFIGGIIVGQLIAAMALDHFAILGLSPRSFDLKRGLATLLLLLGFYLSRR